MTETTILQFQNNKTTTKLSNVYVAPCAPVEELYSLVLDILKDNYQNEDDFNIDMLQDCNEQKKMCFFMKSHNYRLHTTKEKTTFGSLIDHFLTTFPFEYIKFQIYETY